MDERPTIKETHDSFFYKACQNLRYDESTYEVLLIAAREIRVELPLKKDDGSIVVHNGYRVQHHNARGPYKGGLRYHPSVNMADVRGLACLMSLKTSLVDIPLGGGKGGIDCDPYALTERELENLTRKFVQRTHRMIGPNLDVMAPDVGTDARIMAWIQDEYSKIYGHTPAVVTGKPVETGGSPAREDATGRGIGTILEEYARHQGNTLEGKTAVIQGFGNVGSHAARILAEMGMKVIAVSDVRGGIFNPEGLAVPKILAHSKKVGTVVGASHAETISNEALLELECDYLIPAALERVITLDNAHRIRAKVIANGANAPITDGADDLLCNRGVTILPSILVSAGGVTASYFEWVQNLQQFSWPLKEVRRRIQDKLLGAARAVFRLVEQDQCSYRDAAYLIATRRLKDAFFAAGF